MADDLDRFARTEPILARPVGRAERFGRWCRRRPAVASLSLALIVVASGALAVYFGQRKARGSERTSREHQ